MSSRDGSEQRLAPDSRERFAFRGDSAVAELAAEEWGVLSTAELHDCGLTRSAIGRRRARGHLHQLYTGVWAVGHPNPPWEGRMLAAVKACGPGALLSHYSAAELWKIVDRLERIADVTVSTRGARAIRGIRIHRALTLAQVDARIEAAIPVTRERQALLEAHGESVLRLHWRDAVLRPSRTCELLAAAGAPHRT